ncbi:esterase/lipase family protein [Saccharothrix sp. HUAS TT1]|uniref:esterase/lipase family protein n=1 Tax=unclassified Saccharothrix TaxID=2593673 RepID=UPI00345BADD3
MSHRRPFAVIRGPVAAVLAALTVAAALLISSGSAPAAVDRDPVLLIPGMTAQASAMDPMRTNFLNAGWPGDRVFTWTDSDNMKGDLTKAGVELGRQVDRVLGQTGARKVVLVTWSASTLAARSYLKNVGGAQDKVSLYFSMAGPHHGTTAAAPWCQNLYPSCKQFAIGSPWLAELNRGTEVPGSPAVRYTTIRSTCDTNVNPSASAELAGADNRQAPTCIDHFAFPRDPGVFALIKKVITESGTTPPTSTGTSTTSTPRPPYTDTADGTAVDHFVAQRVDVTEYNALGARHGYSSRFPLYLCDTGWTDKSDCSPI